MARRRWRDLTPAQRGAVLALAPAELSLAVTAWTDLARRPRSGVRGPRSLWAAVVAVSFVGPVAYFRWGRRVP